MKVYEVIMEVDDYKSLLAVDESVHDIGLLALDGSSKTGEWGGPLEAEFDNIEGLVPDIYSLNAGNIVLSGRALEILKPKISDSCELLPVFWSDGKGYVVNVLGYVDCLNQKKTEWLCDDDSGKKLFIETYEFIKDSLPDLYLFKVEESSFTLLTVDREDGTECLKSIVEDHQLTGLSFELLWQCD